MLLCIFFLLVCLVGRCVLTQPPPYTHYHTCTMYATKDTKLPVSVAIGEYQTRRSCSKLQSTQGSARLDNSYQSSHFSRRRQNSNRKRWRHLLANNLRASSEYSARALPKVLRVSVTTPVNNTSRTHVKFRLTKKVIASHFTKLPMKSHDILQNSLNMCLNIFPAPFFKQVTRKKNTSEP